MMSSVLRWLGTPTSFRPNPRPGAERKAPPKNTIEYAALYDSIQQTVQGLRDDPHDEHLQKMVESAFAEHLEVVYDVLKEEVLVPVPPTPSPHVPGPRAQYSDKDWFNHIGEQRSTPARKLRPACLKDLLGIILDNYQLGCGNAKAIGSGYSFSDITNADSTILIDTSLLTRVSEVDQSTLRPGVRGELLLNVQAGVTLRSLARELDKRGLAQINMGGSDAETIGGAFATGTHGSGISFGALSSSVRAIVMLALWHDEIFQVEKSEGITDPAKFKKNSYHGEIEGVPIRLMPIDKWFNAIVTSIGCIGIHYSYVIEVTPAYSIREIRSSTTWDDIKTSFMPSLWDPVPRILAENDHLELFLNPYNVRSRNACVKVERNRLPSKAQWKLDWIKALPQRLSIQSSANRLVSSVRKKGAKKDWLESLLKRLSIQSPAHLLGFLNSNPFLSPLLMDAAMMTLESSKPYVDKSFNVFNLGPANEIKALALELHCDAKLTVPEVDKLLDILRDEVSETMMFLVGPITIRWIAASEAYVAPSTGRMTCAIEVTMLVRDNIGADIIRHVKERMCGNPEFVAGRREPVIRKPVVRVHWGMDMSLVTSDDFWHWYPQAGDWVDILYSPTIPRNKFIERLDLWYCDPTC